MAIDNHYSVFTVSMQEYNTSPNNDPSLARFTSADSIVPPGVQGLDRYVYANNSPLVYSDPTGHCVIEGHQMDDSMPACQALSGGSGGNINWLTPSTSDPEPLTTLPNVGSGISGAQMYDMYQFFGNLDDLLQFVIMKELGGWWQNSQAFDDYERAVVTRFYDYAKRCNALSFNCLMNFFAVYSQSAGGSYSEIMSGNYSPEYLMRWYGVNVTNDASVNKGEQAMKIVNALYNPPPEWLTVGINEPYDVGILSVAQTTLIPQQGKQYANQFDYYENVLYDFNQDGVPERGYSVILTYCQWVYWTNGRRLASGCHTSP